MGARTESYGGGPCTSDRRENLVDCAEENTEAHAEPYGENPCASDHRPNLRERAKHRTVDQTGYRSAIKLRKHQRVDWRGTHGFGA